jgi:hypothetical protein
MKSLLVAAALALAATPTLARGPTPLEKAICKPEALRLCSLEQLLKAAVLCGDGSKRCPPIYRCFREHRREIGPACDMVLKKHRH